MDYSSVKHITGTGYARKYFLIIFLYFFPPGNQLNPRK